MAKKKRAPDAWKSLNALLGVYGVMTSKLMSNQDYWTCASALWGSNVNQSEATGILDLQKQIKAMSKTERRKLARANIKNVPENFISQANIHQLRLVRSREQELRSIERVKGK